jgi:hypothetical protein
MEKIMKNKKFEIMFMTNDGTEEVIVEGRFIEMEGNSVSVMLFEEGDPTCVAWFKDVVFWREEVEKE